MTLLGDPSTVDAVVPHNIILCDVQGVGHSLDSKKQGAFLIREIKAHCPDKYVIAYTGGSMNQTLTREAIQNSDGFLKKDEIIEEWTEKLDDVISKLLNPYFHQAHRAVDDCHALLEVLAFELPTTGAPTLALLLETARKPTLRVWAEQTAFELKDSLKRRGYRWNDGSDGRPKSWFIDVAETAIEDEIAFLRTHIYMQDVEPAVQRLTAFTRFSGRI